MCMCMYLCECMCRCMYLCECVQVYVCVDLHGNVCVYVWIYMGIMIKNIFFLMDFCGPLIYTTITPYYIMGD